MGMPVTERHRWTADEVRALPEEPGKRFEVIDGDLIVSPGPSLMHQRVGFVLQEVLNRFARQQGIGYALAGPGEVEPDPHTLVQPDIFVVAPVNGRCPRTTDEIEKIFLVCEVLSPSSGRIDRVRKRQLYQRMLVEYWIVDPPSRMIERWQPADERPSVHDSSITFITPNAVEPLTIDLTALFEEALDS